ncbi:hypothetical protein [Nocardioides sp.]|uniref:hypothetical protein n=1 Tax=Nocardioides sp. TaxID=35761 RepID=UPI002B270F1E|nr:hypothetical protein [Nocardioides sp.]
MGSERDRASRPQLSRRAVVHAAATTAWAAPVVLVASAAPARASVSGEPQVRAGSIVSSRDNNQLDVSVTFTNDSTADTSGLTVLVRFNDSTTATAALTQAPTGVAGGFAYVGIDAPATTSRTYEFVRLDPQLTGSGAPATATATLGFRIRVYPLAAGNYLGTILVTPVPTGPQGGSGTPAGPTPYT